MFTGLIEEVGTVEEIEPDAGGRKLVVSAQVVASDLREGDSVSLNGCCQTVIAAGGGHFTVVSVPETLSVTTLGALVEGDEVNLERPVRMMDRLGGHLVQGHVDGVGKIRTIREESPGWRIEVETPPALMRFIAHKGSIAVDGASLTVAEIDEASFSVAIIPHTWAATICRHYRPGTEVNLEVDLVARYLERLVEEVRG
jgi:riboflavin synthase